MKRTYKILIIVAIVLIAFRLFLPSIVLKYVNNQLADLKGYYGKVEDIDISLYRGAYQINNIFINKVDSANNAQTEFFKAKQIDLSVEWGALFNGAIVGELVFGSPKLVFTNDKVELNNVKKDTTDFRELLNDLMPLTINRFEINNGSIHYVDETSNPKVDISLNKTHIIATNLTNIKDKEKLLPSTIIGTAEAYEGSLHFNMKLNALRENPTFDLNAELKNTNLILFNDFLKAYGNFDVNKGTFGLYTELAAENGKFTGYVKPIIKDLDVVGVEDKDDNLFQNIWESIIGGIGVIFKNQNKDQVATKIPIEGNFDNPQTNILDAIWELLRNAFIQALIPSIDQAIDINSVKTDNPNDTKNTLQNLSNSNKVK